MSDITLERLQVEVEAPTTQAEKSISSLADTLGKLKNATKNLGLNGVAKQVSTLNTSLNGVSSDNAESSSSLRLWQRRSQVLVMRLRVLTVLILVR